MNILKQIYFFSTEHPGVAVFGLLLLAVITAASADEWLTKRLRNRPWSTLLGFLAGGLLAITILIGGITVLVSLVGHRSEPVAVQLLGSSQVRILAAGEVRWIDSPRIVSDVDLAHEAVARKTTNGVLRKVKAVWRLVPPEAAPGYYSTLPATRGKEIALDTVRALPDETGSEEIARTLTLALENSGAYKVSVSVTDTPPQTTEWE